MPEMNWWHADQLLIGKSTWAPMWIASDENGCISQLQNTKPDSQNIQHLDGYVLPGFPNSHSHAFQYAMAGLTEHLLPNAINDDFWSWRETMYRIALSLTPEQVEAIAAQLYAEMVRHGIVSVTEFHYLHHDPTGNPYRFPAEMSQRLMSAAQTAGIALNLVPVFYKEGGFDKSASREQRRFIFRDKNHYFELLSSIRESANDYPRTTVGIGIHSLRAASKADIQDILSSDQPKGTVRHIHIAEQTKEVEECLAKWGQRPVEWLLNHLEVNSDVHLVHATHMNATERARLAATKATAVICPSTEGNLGDGFFSVAEYMREGGRFAIGTDSHISLSPWEDLRWLDYGVRLREQRRNPLCHAENKDSAALLYDSAWHGGWQANGDPRQQYFQVGNPFDALVINKQHPSLVGKPADKILATILYCLDSAAHVQTIAGGKSMVKQGVHINQKKIAEAYASAMNDLSD